MQVWLKENPKLSRVLQCLAVGLLIYFISGWKAIPMHSIWGLDLQCIWSFHHCEGHSNSPYLVDGNTCGDIYNRPMVYPPLHYWTFAWTRLLDFKTAVIYLAIAILGVLFFSFAFWNRDKKHHTLFLGVWTLFVLQYPSIFQIERGSNDLPVYLWFIASLWAFEKRNYLWSGLFCALCASTKLYPVFLCAPLVLVTLFDKDKRRWVWGMFIGLVLAHILTPLDSINYYLKVMPAHASNDPPIFDEATVSHSIRSIFPSKVWLALLLFFTTLAIYTRRAWQLLSSRPVYIYSLGIALSTYFATVSYDYHLILVYPLLFYVFRAAVKSKIPMLYLFFILGICFFFWDRQFLIDHKLGALLTKLQFSWLSATVIWGHKFLKINED